MFKLPHIWPVGNSSSWFLYPLDTEDLPTQQDVPGSSVTFPSPTWNQPFLQGALVPFSRGMTLENKI